MPVGRQSQELRNKAGETVTLTVEGADGAVREVDGHAPTARGGRRQGCRSGSAARSWSSPASTRAATSCRRSRAGVAWTVSAFTLILNGLADLVASIVSNPGQAPPVSGPVGIAVQVGDVFWQLGPIFTLYLAGLLSANLALVNILPFPPLDGGRMLVLVLKAVLSGGGRALRTVGIRVNGPSAETTMSVERLTYLVGFVFLFGFLIWITYFDIARQVGGGTP